MKISTKTRYGLRALIYIGTEMEKDERFIGIKEISEHEKISVQYLEQILFRLKKQKFIKGRRGPKGGYILGKDPEDISVYDIFLILEEEKRIVLCDKEQKNCNHVCCPTIYLWEKLEDSITDIMKKTTIQEMIESQKEKVNA